MQRLDFASHADAQLGIEVRQRFVEQEDLRIAHDGAAHGDALALAARERRRLAGEILGQVQDRSGGLHPLLDQLLVGAPYAQRKRHVFRDRHMRVQGITLENHGDVACLGRQVGHVAPVDGNPPGVRGLQPRQQAEQGGFPAAGRPDQGQKLAIAD